MSLVTAGGNVKTRYFHHRDHLGSVGPITVNSGAVDKLLSNDPFGGRRAGDWSSDATQSEIDEVLDDYHGLGARGFTDHEHLDRISIVHMNGRIYDPRLGRFLQADPIVQAPGFSQSHNRYAYVFNTPLSLVDPSGYGPFDDHPGFEGIVGPIAAWITTAPGAQALHPLEQIGASGEEFYRNLLQGKRIDSSRDVVIISGLDPRRELRKIRLRGRVDRDLGIAFIEVFGPRVDTIRLNLSSIVVSNLPDEFIIETKPVGVFVGAVTTVDEFTRMGKIPDGSQNSPNLGRSVPRWARIVARGIPLGQTTEQAFFKELVTRADAVTRFRAIINVKGARRPAARQPLEAVTSIVEIKRRFGGLYRRSELPESANIIPQ